MKVGSLFTGIGGFDLGFDRAGFTTVWQVEYDEKCQETLAHHWPNVRRYKDVREVGSDLEAVDVITGGFPCQDLSVAGKRKGFSGERSGLWFEFHRILAALTPRFCVIENVPGLLSSNGGRDFAVLLRGLVECGYGVAWRILDAQYLGLAQRRRRVFIVGSLGDYRCAEILFEPESVSGDSPPSREAGKDVAYTIRSNPSHSGDKGDGEINTMLITYGQGIDTTGHQGDMVFGEGDVWATLSAESCNNGGGSNGLLHTCTTIRSSVPMNDDNAAQAGHLVTRPLTARHDSSEDGCGRGTPIIPSYWDGGQVSDTLDSAQISKGQMMPDKRRFPCVQQSGVRRLTPTECERLQGFPDGWTAMHADTVRYRQLGNAVAVPIAEWIGRRIQEKGK